MKRLDFKLENVPYVVSSCIVLHNMCELYGDNCLDEWTNHSATESSNLVTTPTSAGSNVASDIRDAIMQHLAT